MVKTNSEKVRKNDCDPTRNIWCPFCDKWFLKDGSRTARKRLGEHICDIHNEEVSYPVGVIPPKVED